jgi:ATP/ADP translocase
MEAVAVFQILIPALWAWGLYTYASRRGFSSPELAAVLGFFFGLFALIGYALHPTARAYRKQVREVVR